VKKLFAILVILSLVLPGSGGAVTAEDGDCECKACAALSCCANDSGGAEQDAPANVPSGQQRVSAPDLAPASADLFLRALDARADSVVPADRLFRLPKLHVSARVRNCAFLI